MEKVRCSAEVMGEGGWHRRPCARNGVIQRDGKWYCKQHDPVAVKKRMDDQKAQWEKEWEEDKKKRYRDRAMQKACEGVPTKVLEKISVKELLDKLEE